MFKRYIAHITLEAETPLKVGSNGSDFLQDSPIQRDWNGLPMILGTSIAGVLRNSFLGDKEDIFGKENGSKLIVSNALLVDEDNKVNEKLLLKKSPFLQLFDTLPIREHTAINDKGVAKEHSKFDEEVVYKGSRFKFSLEFIEDDEKLFTSILDQLASPSFRLGGGSTKGFGKFKVYQIEMDSFDIDGYKSVSSSLNSNLKNSYQPEITQDSYTVYTLEIKPDDFFMFGSGFGDDEADMTPVYEKMIDYHNKSLSKDMILIPASSLKGAIAHRATYHYNLDKKQFIGDENVATSLPEIFGSAKDKEKDSGSKGKLIMSDCYKSDKLSTKVFDHVSIDRFTGGAIDGALFQEKTVADDSIYKIEILLEKDIDQEYVKAFESTLTDITTGMLALGGATTKGHGVFTGTWSKS
jgi:CRISPR/Cas system CMR subunit Cmr4 (Cas7 group RAMP superfamily)